MSETILAAQERYKYLSIEQALEDTVYFATHSAHQDMLKKKPLHSARMLLRGYGLVEAIHAHGLPRSANKILISFSQVGLSALQYTVLYPL